MFLNLMVLLLLVIEYLFTKSANILFELLKMSSKDGSKADGNTAQHAKHLLR